MTMVMTMATVTRLLLKIKSAAHTIIPPRRPLIKMALDFALSASIPPSTPAAITMT